MLIIGIYGGTGSGKTTIVKEIMSKFNSSDINVISQDSYYKDNSHVSLKKRSLINFDHPSSVDFELLYNHLKKLKNDCDLNDDFLRTEENNKYVKLMFLHGQFLPRKCWEMQMMRNHKTENWFVPYLE